MRLIYNDYQIYFLDEGCESESIFFSTLRWWHNLCFYRFLREKWFSVGMNYGIEAKQCLKNINNIHIFLNNIINSHVLLLRPRNRLLPFPKSPSFSLPSRGNVILNFILIIPLYFFIVLLPIYRSLNILITFVYF